MNELILYYIKKVAWQCLWSYQEYSSTQTPKHININMNIFIFGWAPSFKFWFNYLITFLPKRIRILMHIITTQKHMQHNLRFFCQYAAHFHSLLYHIFKVYWLYSKGHTNPKSILVSRRMLLKKFSLSIIFLCTLSCILDI